MEEIYKAANTRITEQFNFSLFSKKEVKSRSVPEVVANSLGIGAKKKIYDPTDTTTRQRETICIKSRI
jgi:hypothetical protein